MEEAKKIWIDGDFVDWKDAKVHILANTLHYGIGAFEGIRAYKTDRGPAVFRLKEHIDRFFYSVSCLGAKMPFEKEEIEKAILKTIKVNGLEECYIRPIAFFGYGTMKINPVGVAPLRVAIAAWPWGAYLGGDKPVSVEISKFRRLDPRSIIPEAKMCGYYINSFFATQQAKKDGFNEALLLDSDGYLAEGPGENVFIVKEGKILTPPLGSILPGITRRSVIKIAADMGIEVEEKKISLEEAKSADEAFFAGTAAEICPIGKIDNLEINQGKMGEVTKKISRIYKMAIHGKDEKYREWLTFVKDL